MVFRRRKIHSRIKNLSLSARIKKPMRVRLQYILFVLLFVAVGALCRMHNASHLCPTCACVQPVLSQTLKADNAVRAELLLACSTTADNTASGRFFAHSLFAPELTCCSPTQNTDSKVMTRVVSLFGHDVPACPTVAGSAEMRAAGMSARGVDYYVYTLGKIRI